MAGVPVKWAFFRKVSRLKSVESGRGLIGSMRRLRMMATSTYTENRESRFAVFTAFSLIP